MRGLGRGFPLAKVTLTCLTSVAAMMALVGCDGDDSSEANTSSAEGTAVASEATASESASSATSTAEAEEKSKDAKIKLNTEGMRELSPERFSNNGSWDFIVEIDGVRSACFIYTGATCIGEAPDSVPDIEVPPFPKMRPSAISLGKEGLVYTMVEGRPPAKEELKTGDFFSYGDVRCGKPDDSTVICESENAAFAIEGKDRKIRTMGKVFDSWEEAAGPTPTNVVPSDDYEGRDHLIQKAPMLCGAATGQRLAEIVKGEMSCKEAIEILDRYNAVMHQEGGGNTLAVQLGDWGCNSPTAARSQEIGASSVCENVSRGLRVHDPVFSSGS